MCYRNGALHPSLRCGRGYDSMPRRVRSAVRCRCFCQVQTTPVAHDMIVYMIQVHISTRASAIQQ
eukprot:57032-Eustigmatos_ZCMA.PRE.1